MILENIESNEDVDFLEQKEVLIGLLVILS
jgi:hypothetical protein